MSSFGVHVSRSTGVLCFYHYYFSFLIHIVFKFYIIRTYRSILIRNGCHHSQFVVEEAVAISETQVQLGFLANPVVSGYAVALMVRL